MVKTLAALTELGEGAILPGITGVITKTYETRGGGEGDRAWRRTDFEFRLDDGELKGKGWGFEREDLDAYRGVPIVFIAGKDGRTGKNRGVEVTAYEGKLQINVDKRKGVEIEYPGQEGKAAAPPAQSRPVAPQRPALPAGQAGEAPAPAYRAPFGPKPHIEAPPPSKLEFGDVLFLYNESMGHAKKVYDRMKEGGYSPDEIACMNSMAATIAIQSEKRGLWPAFNPNAKPGESCTAPRGETPAPQPPPAGPDVGDGDDIPSDAHR